MNFVLDLLWLLAAIALSAHGFERLGSRLVEAQTKGMQQLLTVPHASRLATLFRGFAASFLSFGHGVMVYISTLSDIRLIPPTRISWTQAGVNLALLTLAIPLAGFAFVPYLWALAALILIVGLVIKPRAQVQGASPVSWIGGLGLVLMGLAMLGPGVWHASGSGLVGITDFARDIPALLAGGVGLASGLLLGLALGSILPVLTAAVVLVFYGQGPVFPVFLLVGALVGAAFQLRVQLGHRTKASSSKDSQGLGGRILSRVVPGRIDSNLVSIHQGLASMTDSLFEVLMLIMNQSQEVRVNEAQILKAQALVSGVLALGNELNTTVVHSTTLARTWVEAERIQLTMRIADDLMAVGTNAMKVLVLLERSSAKNFRFHPSSRDELFGFVAQVLDFFRYTSDWFANRVSSENLTLAQEMEASLDQVRDRLTKRSRKHLERSQEADAKAELAFIEIVGHLERIGDHCLSMARSVFRIRELLKLPPW